MVRTILRKIKMYKRIYYTFMAYKLQKLLGNVIYSLHGYLFIYFYSFIRRTRTKNKGFIFLKLRFVSRESDYQSICCDNT